MENVSEKDEIGHEIIKEYDKRDSANNAEKMINEDKENNTGSTKKEKKIQKERNTILSKVTEGPRIINEEIIKSAGKNMEKNIFEKVCRYYCNLYSVR